MEYTIKVVNKRGLSPEIGWSDIYVGRPSILGNPFAMKSESDRDSVVSDYRKWLWQEIKKNTKVKSELISIVDRILSGEKIRLVCFCHPKLCHADIIRSAVIWLVESQY